MTADTRPGIAPSLMLVGVGKAGTTSLFWYLSQLPEICASSVKETRYFLPCSEADAQATGRLPSNDYYSNYFAHRQREQFLMDGTPHYFHGGLRLIESIRETVVDPRIVITLREPIARVRSIYEFGRAMLQLPPDLGYGEFVDSSIAAYRAGIPRPATNRANWAVSGSVYAAFIGPWLDSFPANRLKIVFFDDLVHDPRGTLEDTCRWLGLDVPRKGVDYSTQNRTEMYRRRWLQRAALKLNSDGLLRNHRRLKAPLRSAYYRLNRQPLRTPRDDAADARLRAVFEQPNTDVAALLRSHGATDLPAWLPAVQATESVGRG